MSGAIIRIDGDIDDDIVRLLKMLGCPPVVVDPTGNGQLLADGVYDGIRIVQVIDVDEACDAVASGAAGIIARGNEAAGRSADLSSFVFVQQLRTILPESAIWVQGGIGLYTARGIMALGAHGLVLDEHVALLPGAGTDDAVRSRIKSSISVRTERADGVRFVTSPFSNRNAENRVMEASQTLFLAVDYSQRFRTVRRVVREFVQILSASPVPKHVSDWIASNPLPSPCPVIQGPMTRVSDQAQFSRVVAADGGLPTVALGSLSPSDARQLLVGTAEALGDLPWAAGVLGFLPDKLLEAHMGLIEEVAPKFVVLAGGNVQQARRLESQGIGVLLHCPSPILLRQMFSSGHRRFIFEGNECGGHIGPMNSFALWEQQFKVLEELASENAINDVEITLAGGIHDSVSAAAAIEAASPLQKHGVRVNILVGTAYLLTREAVECGMITKRYQEELFKARTTATITTAPGHTTRCLDTPFVNLCEETRRSLQNESKTDQEIWAALENMNLGRLRLAAKGLTREKGHLVPVDEDHQFSEGLFMAGEIAVLRDSKTTVSELHKEITEGARRHLERLLKRSSSSSPRDSQIASNWSDIAIIGMAGVFPGASSLADYWKLVRSGRCTVRSVPEARWLTRTFTTPSDDDRPMSSSDRGAFLPPVKFDPTKFGIPPNSLAAIDPAQVLALKVASDALEDWEYSEQMDGDRISVVFGVESGGDLSSSVGLRTLIPHYLGQLPKEFDEVLPPITPDSFPGMLANVCAGRVANRLDLGGLNCTVDAACGSSMAALNLAIDELILERCDVALAGGVDLHNAASDYVMFSSLGALSPTGEARVFDDSADGIVLGEGAGCLVLKRLSDAERDGDPIRAVIRGIGASSDGRGLGLTAPRVDGQIRAFDRAYTVGNVDRNSVGLIEAHGTGTALGDRAEMATIERFFGSETRNRIRLGSVKAQIGHTKCAAGIAGMIKAVLCVEQGALPLQPALSAPISEWNSNGRIKFQDQTVPWVAAPSNRVAGVSAFGFGGTNYHAVISGYEGHEAELDDGDWPVELVVGWGASLAEAVKRVRAIFDSQVSTDDTLMHVAEKCWKSRQTESEQVQFAVVSSSKNELSQQLKMLGDHRNASRGIFRRRRSAVPDGHVIGLLPGQGSQSVNMLAELFSAMPFAARRLQVSQRVSDVIYPGQAFSSEYAVAQKKEITKTNIAQPALFMCSAACLDIMRRAGIEPQSWIGHSLGEITALYAAGVVGYENALAIVEARAAAMDKAIRKAPGAMLAVASNIEQVKAVLDVSPIAEKVVIANDNSPRQVVLSGDETSIAEAEKLLRNYEISVKRLNVAGAFHSAAMEPAAKDLQKILEGMNISCPCPGSTGVVWSNRTASPYDFSKLNEEISKQLYSSVMFRDSVRRAFGSGARVFIEIGPKSVLSRLVEATLEGEEVLCTGIEKHATGIRGLMSMFGELLVEGIDLNLGWLFEDRGPTKIVSDGHQSVTLLDGRFRSSNGSLLKNSMLPSNESQVDLTEFSHEINMQSGGVQSLSERTGDGFQSGTKSDEMVSNSPDLRLFEIPVDGKARTVEEEWWDDMMETRFDDRFRSSHVEAREQSVVAAYFENMRKLGSDQTKIVELVLRMSTDGRERGGVDLPVDYSTQPLHEVRGLSEPLPIPPEAAGPDQEQRLVPDHEVSSAAAPDSSSRESSSDGKDIIANDSSTTSVGSLVSDVRGQVKNIISDMTGYPVEMIDDGVDLEADLSIDSIKRMEVAGALLEKFGLERDSISSSSLEELSSAGSVDAVSEWIQEQLDHSSESETDSSSTTTDRARSERQDASISQPRRLVMSLREHERPEE